MPSTYNGIGTRYGARKNATQYPGTCQSCHRQVTLSSYDTRLFFCVFFIPIIPLKRLRIIHHCPVCTRHYAQPFAEWEAARQLRVSGAAEEFRSNPTPEAAMALHDQLVAFQQQREAAAFRDIACAKYPEHAKLHDHFGATLVNIGMRKESEPYFARAFELRPDLPDARASRARVMIAAGRLDEARGLLDFMEKPGSAQLYNLGALEELSEAMAVNRRHAEMIEISRHLLAEIPAAKDHARFRQRVEASEKALGLKESMLPKQKFSIGRFFRRTPAEPGVRRNWKGVLATLAVIFAVVSGIVFLSHTWSVHHRTLHVLNAAEKPAIVEIIGGPTLQIAPHSVGSVPLAEGDYRARIRGPVEEEMAVPVHSDAEFPWVGNPAWVLNVGGFGAVNLLTAHYAKGGGAPTEFEPHFGEKLWTFPDVEYAFRELPHTITVDQRQGGKTMRALQMFQDDPAQLVAYFTGKGLQADALRAAYWVLSSQPGSDGALLALQVIPRTDPERAKARDFLRAGLARRPVVIPWHRAFQNLSRDDYAIPRMYATMLARAPDDSALLYLLGRVTEDAAEQAALFTRARAADEKNPYPHFALGYDALSEGDFDRARTLLDRACELKPDDLQMSDTRHLVRLAQRDYAEIERELRGALGKDFPPAPVFSKLVEALALQGRVNDARLVVRDFEGRLRVLGAQGAANLAVLNTALSYGLGDFTVIERERRNQPVLLGMILVDEGKVAEALALPGVEQSFARGPVQALAVALAWQLAGEQTRAEDWIARARTNLGGLTSPYRRAANLLGGTGAPDHATVTALHMDVNVKAVLLAVLARKFPSDAEWLNGFAARLNCKPEFPFHLVRRAVKP